MMSPKTLLMPLSSSGQVEERLQGALAIVQFFGAHLEIMHAQVTPRRFFPDDRISLAVPAELLHQLEALASKSTQHESAVMRSIFAQLCQDVSVELIDKDGMAEGTSASWLDVTGLRSEMVAERGKVSDTLHNEGYDLLVMGAYTHRRVHEQVFGGVTSYVVGHARIPALMMH